LKLNSVEIITCAYCKGSGTSSKENPWVTPESFKRRAFWLIQNPQFVLVHYLDEANRYFESFQKQLTDPTPIEINQ